MKKIYFILFSCLLLVGCGNYNGKNASKDLENKINNLKSYNLTGTLEIKSNEDIYKYNVDVSYKKDDNFRVSLINQTNNHEQIILKNKDGVYVLTPSLNKSFKFQSDWPYNNSQTYLLQTLLDDIKKDNNKKFKNTKENYIFETKVNYPNNQDLVKQKIYFDKKLKPKKVEVMDNKNNVLISMNFNNLKFNPKFKKKYFELEENMNASITEETSKSVGKIEEDIYPMYIPENTKLSSRNIVDTKEGQRAITSYEGDNSFMFVEETAKKADELEIVSVYGDPYQMASSIAAVSDNMVTWLANGNIYYVVSDNMSEEDLINVASSVSSLPVSK
ncbi:MAG: outer membrane lipoprotein carrier protein LolA [Bacilli bacterium]|nr:outer membrane lipoprotein carrier protein LolA [Bacilli bacterium]